ncbi:hypothetical protein AB6A40_007811 [Gnathostoma spinigerum]|uniref:Uncharacterized protein n=1 Tax=Gnathostoma spinigerum TaxID=75299 RepID=A0ABD6EPJ8_9BILA
MRYENGGVWQSQAALIARIAMRGEKHDGHSFGGGGDGRREPKPSGHSSYSRVGDRLRLRSEATKCCT